MDKNTHNFLKIKHTTETDYIIPGNVIPHEWYKKITDSNGNPDFLNIIILADIIAWFRYLAVTPSKYDSDLIPELENDSLKVSYQYFQEKFSISKERIRKAFVKLENTKIIFREVRNVVLKNGSRNNKLFLNIDPNFFNSCFRSSEFDVRIKIKEKKKPSLQYQGDYISNKNIKKNRSMGSNFVEKDLEEEKELKQKSEILKLKTKKHVNFFSKPKKLSEFYPLSAEDGNILRSATGRYFSLNAMNEILKSLGNKLNNRIFNSKKGFMSYMEKVFEHEMRNEMKVSNETFRIRANLTEEDKIEEYLTEIENTSIVSPEWHLKKKLACVLRPKTAYEILKNYKKINVIKTKVEFELRTHVELTDLEENIILSQIKATHERVGDDGIYLPIDKLELIMPLKKNKSEENAKIEIPPRIGIWGNIRTKISEYLGRNGDAIDTNWISKLEAEIDEQNKQIKLKAPSDFYRKYIVQDYECIIRIVAESCGFTFKDIYC